MRFDAAIGATLSGLYGNIGDTFTRIRPVEARVDGETTEDLAADVVTGRTGILYAANGTERNGTERELGWGQAPEMGPTLQTTIGEDIQIGDLIDMTSGKWTGQRFRVTKPDPGVGIHQLELVSAANRSA